MSSIVQVVNWGWHSFLMAWCIYPVQETTSSKNLINCTAPSRLEQGTFALASSRNKSTLSTGPATSGYRTFSVPNLVYPPWLWAFFSRGVVVEIMWQARRYVFPFCWGFFPNNPKLTPLSIQINSANHVLEADCNSCMPWWRERG